MAEAIKNQENCPSPAANAENDSFTLCPESPEIFDLSTDGAGVLCTPNKGGGGGGACYIPTPPKNQLRKSISLQQITPACSPAYYGRRIPKEDRANVTFCLDNSDRKSNHSGSLSKDVSVAAGTGSPSQPGAVHFDLEPIIKKITSLKLGNARRRSSSVSGIASSPRSGCASPKMMKQFQSPSRPQF